MRVVRYIESHAGLARRALTIKRAVTRLGGDLALGAGEGHLGELGAHAIDRGLVVLGCGESRALW